MKDKEQPELGKNYAQHLADGINDLVEDLPRRPKKPPKDAAWQRVLGEQVLNEVLRDNGVLAAAMHEALVYLFTEKPSLRDAVRTALGWDYKGPDDPEELTPYAEKTWGWTLENAAATSWYANNGTPRLPESYYQGFARKVRERRERGDA